MRRSQAVAMSQAIRTLLLHAPACPKLTVRVMTVMLASDY